MLKSGIPNAIKIFNEEVLPRGFRPKGVRIDSGDIAYLSKKVRKHLDEVGFEDCPIIASNSLDEYIIRDILLQGGKVDSFGVGERLITAKSDPVFGGVYKLVAVEDEEGKIVPKIKVSENVEKITNPGFKTTWRLFDCEKGSAIADVVTLAEEVIDDTKEYEIFHPQHTWKRKTVTNFVAKKLQVPVFVKGECVYESPALADIRQFCQDQIKTLWLEMLRFEHPHKYYIDLSAPLWELKDKLLQEHTIR